MNVGLHTALAATALTFASCGGEEEAPRRLSFGDSSEAPSTTAAELFGKEPSKPTATTLTGVYEALDTQPQRGAAVEGRTRLEIRANRVVTAKRCAFQGETGPELLEAFVASSLSHDDAGVRIGETVEDEDLWFPRRWPDIVYCRVELSAADWRYCIGEAGALPADSAPCLLIDPFSLQLSLKAVDGTVRQLGRKIRD